VPQFADSDLLVHPLSGWLQRELDKSNGFGLNLTAWCMDWDSIRKSIRALCTSHVQVVKDELSNGLNLTCASLPEVARNKLKRGLLTEVAKKLAKHTPAAAISLLSSS